MGALIAASIGFAAGYATHLAAAALKDRKPEVITGERRLEGDVGRHSAPEVLERHAADARSQLILDAFAVIAATEIARRRQ